MSYLMAVGHPAASVALFLPSSSMWLGDSTADTMFVSTERLLSEHQIDFDIVDEDALTRDLIARPGRFETASGNQYHTVILPDPEVISNDMLDRLREFARGGGKVLFLGGIPEWIAGRTFGNARAATAKDFAWAEVANQQLPPTPTPPQFAPIAPPSPQIVSPVLLRALQTAVVAPTITLDSPDTALRVMKRRWRDADVYLFFNEGAKPSDQEVTLSSRGRKVEQWDPQTGTIKPLDSKSAAGHVSIQLLLEPYQTSVMVVR